MLTVNFLGMRLGHFLDVHPTLGGVDNNVFTQATVQQYAHVVLFRLRNAGIVYVLRHQYLVHEAAFGACLLGDKLHTDDVASNFPHLFQIFGQLHPTPFAAPASVDLGFDDVPAGTGIGSQLFGGGYGLLGRVGYDAFLHADAVFFQDFFALIFVNVHKNG